MTQFEELIQNTKLYVDYLEEHYNNVQKALKQMETFCSDELIIYDDCSFSTLSMYIREHDLSKHSPEEFVSYRRTFFPCSHEVKNDDEFQLAWRHHYMNNPHHWQYWLQPEVDTSSERMSFAIAEMVCDWTAMGYKFGDTALAYYTKHKNGITLPEVSRIFLERLLTKMNSTIYKMERDSTKW